MKKLFVYQVAGFEYQYTEAFDEAWRQAKAKAAELHAAIYRLVIKGEDIQQEVFYNGGCFNSIKFATAENVKIF